METVIEAPKKISKKRGGELFSNIMNHFGDNVKAIRGSWTYGSNLSKVNELTSKGVSLEEAISKTYTVHMSKKYGFSKITIEKVIGSPGKYKKIQVLISKGGGHGN